MITHRGPLFLSAVLAVAGDASPAFEPVAQGPWLQGGYASHVFPRSPMASGENPALIGLLEFPCVSFSASRPFGLHDLDRAAAAGGLAWGRTAAVGALLTASGNASYSELTLSVPLAWQASEALVLGVSPSLRRLSIAGYGSATGFSASCGAVCRPLRGVFLSTSLGGILRTGLGGSGDPAAPLSLDVGAGVCPVRNARIAAGASRQEGLPLEASISAAFFPASLLGLEFSFQSDPARFAAAVCFDVSSLEFACGYAEHPALGSTPAVEVTWGLPAFVPEAVESEIHPTDEAAGAGGPDGAAPAGPVNINTAGLEELCGLAGIGPARAEAIIRWREQNGPFGSIGQLADIPGISAALVETLRDDLATE